MEKQAKTRRERIDAALDAMGAAVEEISFAISFYSSGALDVQLIGDKPRCLDGIAAERGAEITETPIVDGIWPVKRSAVIDGATFFQLAEANGNENA